MNREQADQELFISCSDRDAQNAYPFISHLITNLPDYVKVFTDSGWLEEVYQKYGDKALRLKTAESGETWTQKISQAIDRSFIIIVILSQTNNDSNFINQVRKSEVPIIPVVLDPDTDLIGFEDLLVCRIFDTKTFEPDINKCIDTILYYLRESENTQSAEFEEASLSDFSSSNVATPLEQFIDERPDAIKKEVENKTNLFLASLMLRMKGFINCFAKLMMSKNGILTILLLLPLLAGFSANIYLNGATRHLSESSSFVPSNAKKPAHASAVTTVTFSQNNTYAASASHDGTVKIWQVVNGNLLGLLRINSSTNGTLTTVPARQTVSNALQNLRNNQTSPELQQELENALQLPSILGVVLRETSTGSLLAAVRWQIKDADIRTSIYNMDLATGQVSNSSELTAGDRDGNRGLDTLIRPDLAQALIWQNDRRLASVSATSALPSFTNSDSDLNVVNERMAITDVTVTTRVAGEGNQLATIIAGAAQGAVYRFETGGPRVPNPLCKVPGPVRAIAASGATDIVFLLDGSGALWNCSKNARIDLTTGKETVRLEGHSDTVASVAFSPDGRTLASGSLDNTVQISDVTTSQQLDRSTKCKDCRHIAISNDAAVVAFAGSSGSIYINNIGKEDEPTITISHGSSTAYLAISDHHSLVLSASDDGHTRLWDLKTGSPRGYITGHGHLTMTAELSLDGNHLITGALDGTVLISDLGRHITLHQIDVWPKLSAWFSRQAEILFQQISQLFPQGASSNASLELPPESKTYLVNGFASGAGDNLIGFTNLSEKIPNSSLYNYSSFVEKSTLIRPTLTKEIEAIYNNNPDIKINLIGSSFGANIVTRVAADLEKQNIPINYIATMEGPSMLPIHDNVRIVDNFNCTGISCFRTLLTLTSQNNVTEHSEFKIKSAHAELADHTDVHKRILTQLQPN